MACKICSRRQNVFIATVCLMNSLAGCALVALDTKKADLADAKSLESSQRLRAESRRTLAEAPKTELKNKDSAALEEIDSGRKASVLLGAISSTTRSSIRARNSSAAIAGCSMGNGIGCSSRAVVEAGATRSSSAPIGEIDTVPADRGTAAALQNNYVGGINAGAIRSFESFADSKIRDANSLRDRRAALYRSVQDFSAVLPPGSDSSTASDTVRVLFGTNRKTIRNIQGPLSSAFTNTRNELSFGYVDVSIPPGHGVGLIERPTIWKLETSEDPTQHIVIRDITFMQRNQFADIVNQYRGSKNSKPTILFVHGYNVSFDEAARRMAQIAYDLRIDSVPAFFSWASRGGLAEYTLDENTALQSVPDFKNFLHMFATNSTDRIFLIAHSMGSRIVAQAITEMIHTEPRVVSRIVQLVLAAPDLDAVVFKEQIVPLFSGLGIPITLYASSRDKTLQASSKIHGCCRAGLGGKNIVIAEGLESVDATSVDTSFLGHSYFAEARPLLTDLNLLLAQGLRAASRPLLAGKPASNPAYYYFRQ